MVEDSAKAKNGTLPSTGSQMSRKPHDVTWPRGKESRGEKLEFGIFAEEAQSSATDPISRSISILLEILEARDLLHDATPPSVDLVSDLPSEWVLYESRLTEVMNRVVACEASTASQLLAKFDCLAALLRTFGSEDRRVGRMKDALLNESRSWLQRQCDPATASPSDSSRRIFHLSPLNSLFSNSSRSGSRRSQV